MPTEEAIYGTLIDVLEHQAATRPDAKAVMILRTLRAFVHAITAIALRWVVKRAFGEASMMEYA